jgi:L-asparaginase II
MVEPIRVVVRRGAVVEATHRVHAASVDGRSVSARGDHRLSTFLRSSAKPFQALPLARSYDDIDPRELAIASASHLADRAQLDAVRMLLARADATEDELECGRDGDPPSRLNHNCSGKHAGMLAVCRARGWPAAGYRLPDHPVQRQNFHDVAAAAGREESTIPTAVDGCGVLTFALTLEEMATMFTRLESTEEGSAVAGAMRAHPDLIRGPAATDSLLMKLVPGAIAKGGAEGLLCGTLPGGVGFALKCEDGDSRALRPALASFLGPQGFELPGFAEVALVNSRGDTVGSISVADEKSS